MLILASDGPIYKKFQDAWELYMKSNPHIDCYFYKGSSDIEGLVGNTLYIKIEDTLDTVYEKTLRAFAFFRPQLHKYDFVSRPNLSSFVDFELYVRFCRRLPTTRCCAAVIGHHESGIPFPSGSCFTLSTDLVHRLVDEQIPKIEQDDVTVGKALLTWGINIRPVNRLDLQNDMRWRYFYPPTEPVFHYRLKTDDRDRDVSKLLELIHKR